MTDTLDTEVRLSLIGLLRQAGPLATLTDLAKLNYAAHLPSGIATGQADKLWHDEHTLAAGAIFFVGSLAMLPLLLIPGMLLVLPLVWAAWLNQRTFRFDALAEHATAAELKRVVGDNRRALWLAGLVTAGAAHLPLVNLLAPAFTALVFVHLGLAALRRLGQQEGIEL